MSKRDTMFKDRISIKAAYDLPRNRNMLRELTAAVDGGEERLKKVLFPPRGFAHYEAQNNYRLVDYTSRIKPDPERDSRKQECRCMFSLGNTQGKYRITGEYRITDCETEAYYEGISVGAIDLIIEQDGICYAAQIAPYQDKNETFLRMIAEIMTYTADSPYKRAIAFFAKDRDTGEPTAQQTEYEEQNPWLLSLIDKADITVFCFEEDGQDAYRIVKLR